MRAKPLTLVCSLLAWIALVVGGMGLKMKYGFTPGAVAAAVPAQLTDELQDRVQLTAGRSALLVFLHPHCPCSRATIKQLDRVWAIAQESGAADLLPPVHLIFVIPPGVEDGWERGGNLARAERLEGAFVHFDRAGELAQSFSARTSGQVLFYDRNGELRFAGGITPSRGKAGDLRHARALWDVLRRERSDAAESPVYGCPLFHSGDRTCADRLSPESNTECCREP
ncbi:MAG: hypothetical protein EA377_11985 [Phycisphaerales bacterium]|nr:MAG: hypothetical protein EA377_11985 [Phycisphaerales bacterium]